MQRVKKFLKEKVLENQRLIVCLALLFVLGNWLLLILTEQIGPPDFYKLFGVSERLFSGDLEVGIVPPLFPLLLYPLGKLIAVFTEAPAAFIIAGRVIALAASLGVLWFSFLFLKRLVGKYAYPGIAFLAISPWFLKMVSFPITDMLYLFFVTAAFYGFLAKSALGMSIAAVAAGVFTRFEGVLLILSGGINYFKLKKKYFYILLAALPVVLVLFILFAPRIFAHLTDIILPRKSYLYIFQHPMDFVNLIYGNILFFIPYSYPYFFKLALLAVLFVFFLYGVFRLYRIEKLLTISLLAYEFLFFVAKGYLDAADPEREFRRILSGLWIFYMISFIGCVFLLKYVKSFKKIKIPLLIAGGIVLPVLAFSQEPFVLPAGLLPLLLIIGLCYPLQNLPAGKRARILAAVVLSVFALQIYQTSIRRSGVYVESYARKAAYAAARWLNLGRVKDNAVVLSYTDNNIVAYYLDKNRTGNRDVQLIHFTVPLRNIPGNHDRYRELFFQLLKEHNVDYIIFDNYVVQKPEFLGINDVQKMLYEEKENERYFRLRNNLFYKGKNVGYVLKPVYAQTNN